MKNDASNDFLATIDRREGRFFILMTSDNQELRVPVHHFSRRAREGDVIHLHFLTVEQARNDKAELAKHLLEEILNDR